MDDKRSKLPGWMKHANRLVMVLNRMGLAVGTQHILSIPGRRSGLMRSTPVSLLDVDGSRYVVTGYSTDWVKNARAFGWGILTRGKESRPIFLDEMPVEQRAAVLREFPAQVPHGVKYFEQYLGIPGDPEAFAEAAPRCPVFRLVPMNTTGGLRAG